MNNDRKLMWGMLFISALIVLVYNLTTHDLLGFKSLMNSLVTLNLMGIIISGIYIMSLVMYGRLNVAIVVDIKDNFTRYIKGFGNDTLYSKDDYGENSLIYAVCAILGLILINVVVLSFVL